MTAAMWAALGVIASVVGSYAVARLNTRSAAPGAAAKTTKTEKETDGVIVTTTTDLIEAQQAVVESVRTDNDRLTRDMAALRSEMSELRSEMRAAVGARDVRIDTLTRHVDVLEASIRALGGVIPPRPF